MIPCVSNPEPSNRPSDAVTAILPIAVYHLIQKYTFAEDQILYAQIIYIMLFLDSSMGKQSDTNKENLVKRRM